MWCVVRPGGSREQAIGCSKSLMSGSTHKRAGSGGMGTLIARIPGRRIETRWREGGKSAEAWERKGVIVGGECVPEEGFYLFFKDGSHSSVPECWWDGREKH